MEKIKIFTEGTTPDCDNKFTEIEKEYEEWIKNNPNITIISRKASIAGVGMFHAPQITVVVFYKEN